MKPLDIVILLAVGASLAAALIHLFRRRKTGCCGDCARCRQCRK